MRSAVTSVSSESMLAPGPAPISGISGSGSSTSTYFCKLWIKSSFRSPGDTVVSAISRNATTGFLSLSRSTVICDPDEIMRARWLSHRARMISSGSQITVERDNDKNPVVALREIAETTVSPGDLKEDLIHSLQKYVEVDEPEPEMPLIGAGPGASIDSDDTEVTAERMTEEELLKGLEGLAPPEEVPEEDAE